MLLSVHLPGSRCVQEGAVGLRVTMPGRGQAAPVEKSGALLVWRRGPGGGQGLAPYCGGYLASAPSLPSLWPVCGMEEVS